MTPLDQSGPVLVQFSSQFGTLYITATGARKDNDIQTHQVFLCHAKAGSNCAFELISVHCTLQMLFRND